MRPRAKDELSSLSVTPSKERGQNFIINPFVVEKIVQFGAPQPHEKLVEIGPGLGALTAALVNAAPLTIVEIEPRFCAELAARFPSLTIVQSDVRRVDFSTLGSDLTVFGNLPYSFSTDIIFHLLKNRKSIRRAVIMLQREFAERVAADPGSKTYGSLSVAVQLYADAFLGPIIAGDSFHPPTKVESRLLQLTMRASPLVDVQDLEFFEKVVRAAFMRRRKKIANSLSGSGIFTEEDVEAALKETQLDSSRRAESFSMHEFALLAEALYRRRKVEGKNDQAE
jgi:16S rRNA (adenine1518-N6/adenine1519-N6)-dimethyltransferase